MPKHSKFDIKKVYRSEAVASSRYTFNFCSLLTPFRLRFRASVYFFITVLFSPYLSCCFIRFPYNSHNISIPFLKNEKYLFEGYLY